MAASTSAAADLGHGEEEVSLPSQAEAEGVEISPAPAQLGSRAEPPANGSLPTDAQAVEQGDAVPVGCHDERGPDIRPPPAADEHPPSSTCSSPRTKGEAPLHGSCQLWLQLQDNGTVTVSIHPGREGDQADLGQQCLPPSPAIDISTPQVEGLAAVATTIGGEVQLAQQQLEQLCALQEQRRTLLEENQLLQHFARQYIDSGSKASKQAGIEQSHVAGIEQRYAIGLQQLQKLLAQKAAAEVRVQKILEPERERLAAAQARVDAHRQAFLDFIAQLAEASRKSAPGSSKGAVSDKAVQAFLELEPAKAAEVQALRLKNAQLQYQVADIEQKLKDSDRLSDGLHLIDFEQLRIENSTLSYKIEARSSEVLKLRTKLTQTIQMAAHAKEKVHCAEQEKRRLESRLQSTEARLQQCRVELAAAKARREALMGAKAELRQDTNLITDRRCLADMKLQESKLAQLHAEQGRLQQTYEALMAKPRAK